MSKIKVSFERCKACYLCMDNCPQQAIQVSGIQLHPGAERYYKEVGILG